MSYTTEQLISYLEGYISKCMNYQKQLIKQRDKQLDEHQNPDEKIYDNFGKATVKTTESYWEVREQVQQYQRDYKVSGIAWEEVFYRGRSIRVPSLHDQLICLPGDKDILVAAIPEIINWWEQSTEGMDLWQLLDNGESIPISKDAILLATSLAEWAELYLHDCPETNIISETGEMSVEPTLELNLDLCWGNPDEVADADCPESGCVWFFATRRNIGQSELEDIFNR